ncbi:MAG: hypothetical protein KDB03_06105 [Planctomycetales bacterium]|nr:hypothetical protein [Planctomycetales bacterium]
MKRTKLTLALMAALTSSAWMCGGQSHACDQCQNRVPCGCQSCDGGGLLDALDVLANRLFKPRATNCDHRPAGGPDCGCEQRSANEPTCGCESRPACGCDSPPRAVPNQSTTVPTNQVPDLRGVPQIPSLPVVPKPISDAENDPFRDENASHIRQPTRLPTERSKVPANTIQYQRPQQRYGETHNPQAQNSTQHRRIGDLAAGAPVRSASALQVMHPTGISAVTPAVQLTPVQTSNAQSLPPTALTVEEFDYYHNPLRSN